MDKKRELVPLLKQSIQALTELSMELHQLEIHDMDSVSRSVKIKMQQFHKEGPFAILYKKICGIRSDINCKSQSYKSKLKKKQNNINP